MFVSVDLQTILHTQFLDMFILYLIIKLHMPSSLTAIFRFNAAAMLLS